MNNLLQQGDFHIFSFNKKKYVFLSGSQQILEISNPTMDAYFKRCAGRDDGNTLGDTTIDKVTETLKSLCTVPSACCEKQKQDMLTLNVTHGCNMSCKYCFASTLQDRKSVMSLSVAQNAIANMLEGNPDSERYTIYFFGGEPLLHKQFVRDVVEIAKEEIIFRRNKNVCFLLNTNGTLIDDDMMNFFVQEKFTVTVSIDGPQKVNDANRVFLNGRGSFRRIAENIEKLKKGGVDFNLRATISPKNTRLLETFLFFESMEVPYSYAFTIDSDVKDRSTTHFDANGIKTIDKQLGEVMNFFTRKFMGKENIYCNDFQRNINRLRTKSVRYQGCAAGRSSLIVDEAGEYYPCQNMLSYQDMSVGNVSEGIDNSRLQLFRSKEVSQLASCRQCWAKYLCGGSCEAERHLLGQESKDWKQKGKMIRLEWKHLIHSYIKLNDFINNMSNKHKIIDYEKFERAGA